MNQLDQYDYEVPQHLIAQQPLPCRTDARLMVLDRASGSLQHLHVWDFPVLLREGDCLVLNDTRVVPAQLVGYRQTTGGRWQGLFLEADQHTSLWKMLCKTRGRLQPGERIVLCDRHARECETLSLLVRLPEGVWVAKPDSKVSAWELLDRIGRVPLPPYIRRATILEADYQRYQTVFAAEPGSIAAPTAGLHFTHQLLRQLADGGIRQAFVTLHVGIGTFRPIKAESMEEHVLHGEWTNVPGETVEQIERTRAAGGRVVAVGTTVVRALEQAACSGTLVPWTGVTNLFIRPPFSFRVVDALVTNFHLPRSTLLVLVCAFAGHENIRHAYQAAIAEEYRFFSYGDAMFIR